MRTGDTLQGTEISNGLILGPDPRRIGARDPSPEDGTLGPIGTSPLGTGPTPEIALSPIKGQRADLLLEALEVPTTLMRADPAGPLTQKAGPAGPVPMRSGPTIEGWTKESIAGQIMILAKKKVAQSAQLQGTMSLNVIPTIGILQGSALSAKSAITLQTNAWKWKDFPLIQEVEGPWN
jgi:hypothetical protein